MDFKQLLLEWKMLISKFLAAFNVLNPTLKVFSALVNLSPENPLTNTSVLQTHETVVTEKFLPKVLFISVIFPAAMTYVCWNSFQETVNMLFLFVCHRMLVSLTFSLSSLIGKVIVSFSSLVRVCNFAYFCFVINSLNVICRRLVRTWVFRFSTPLLYPLNTKHYIWVFKPMNPVKNAFSYFSYFHVTCHLAFALFQYGLEALFPSLLYDL